MKNNNIEYKVRELIAQGLGMSVDNVKGSHHLVTDLNADSADRLCLVIHLEDEFGTIDDDDAAKWQTVADIVEYCKGRIGAAAQFISTVKQMEKIGEKNMLRAKMQCAIHGHDKPVEFKGETLEQVEVCR